MSHRHRSFFLVIIRILYAALGSCRIVRPQLNSKNIITTDSINHLVKLLHETIVWTLLNSTKHRRGTVVSTMNDVQFWVIDIGQSIILTGMSATTQHVSAHILEIVETTNQSHVNVITKVFMIVLIVNKTIIF